MQIDRLIRFRTRDIIRVINVETSNDTFQRVLALVASGQVRISAHGYEELAADDILVQEILDGIKEAVVVEDYPEYYKGPCVLVLEHESDGEPIHVLWGIPQHKSTPAVVVTAYRPDPAEWNVDFTERKK